MTARFLADKSALARMQHREVRGVLEPLIVDGAIASCGIVELEIAFSARTATALAATRVRPAAAHPYLETAEADFQRALDVMLELARSGHHRAASIPDLIIAAVAERHELGVLHYDADFDVIAAVTGQAVRWVVPRGTVP